MRKIISLFEKMGIKSDKLITSLGETKIIEAQRNSIKKTKDESDDEQLSSDNFAR